MRTGTVGQMQKRAWGFYGYPGSPNLPVGEVRYVVGWHADQMTRLDWDVLIDGSEVWTVDPNPPDTPVADRKPVISTTREVKGPDGRTRQEEDLTAASRELLDLVGWDDTTIRAVDTNLFVGGQGNYIKTGKGWRVVSVVEPKRKETLKDADLDVPFLWPHPADPSKPDAPLFSVLELLSQLEWLDRQAQTQSRQRVMFSGVLATADELIGPDGKSFWDVWNDTLSAKQFDPDDMSPVRLSASVNGNVNLVKDGLNWIMPPFGYDATIDRRSVAAIQRLAYGLPIPPEILLGLQAQSRATAFQVEENSYRAHIEPPAWMVAQVPQDALTEILDDRTVEVRPNPARMLARRQSVSDAFELYDRVEISGDYLREVAGVPDDAAPSPKEREQRQPAATSAPSDPANVAADEPVTAAASDDLSSLLADLDAHLSSELAGVTAMCVDRARQRLGAAARGASEDVRKNADFKTMKSGELATTLGVDGLTAAGVKVGEVIAEPIDAAARWWTNRVTQAWSQAATLVPGWKGEGAWIEESVSVLDQALAEHIVNTLSVAELSPLDAGRIWDVVNAAAGDGDGVR